MVTPLPTTGYWQNGDGLRVKFGTAEADRTGAYVGEYTTNTGDRVLEAVVDLATVAGTAASVTTPYVWSPTVSIPSGAFVKSVEVTVLVETTGVNANLDIGLIRQDMSTELDFNGILAAADAFNGGTDVGGNVTYIYDDSAGSGGAVTTEGGALLGTVLTNTGILCSNYDTAAFTAGRLKIKIIYFIPIVPNS